MRILKIIDSEYRNASQFTVGDVVFEYKYGMPEIIIKVIVNKTSTGHHTFAILQDGSYITASTHYTKAIGEAILLSEKILFY